MTQTVGVVTEDFGKGQPDKIRAIIAGRAKGVDYVYAHPEEAADITAKAYNMDAALVRTVFQHFKAMQWWGRGDLHYKAMDRMVEGMQVVGKLSGGVAGARSSTRRSCPRGCGRNHERQPRRTARGQ